MHRPLHYIFTYCIVVCCFCFYCINIYYYMRILVPMGNFINCYLRKASCSSSVLPGVDERDEVVKKLIF